MRFKKRYVIVPLVVAGIVGVASMVGGFVHEQVEEAEEMAELEELARDEMVPYERLFRELAPSLGWEWETLAAVAWEESHFRPDARSTMGAKGIMQLMDHTAQRFGLNDSTVWIAEDNIRAGVRYIQFLQDSWAFISNKNEQTKFVLASYNAGPGGVFAARRVVRDSGGNSYVWSEVEPYVEPASVCHYVHKVLRTARKYKDESIRRESDSSHDQE